jgi:hypothetical protein
MSRFSDNPYQSPSLPDTLQAEMVSDQELCVLVGHA